MKKTVLAVLVILALGASTLSGCGKKVIPSAQNGTGAIQANTEAGAAKSEDKVENNSFSETQNGKNSKDGKTILDPFDPAIFDVEQNGVSLVFELEKTEFGGDTVVTIENDIPATDPRTYLEYFAHNSTGLVGYPDGEDSGKFDAGYADDTITIEVSMPIEMIDEYELSAAMKEYTVPIISYFDENTGEVRASLVSATSLAEHPELHPGVASIIQRKYLEYVQDNLVYAMYDDEYYESSIGELSKEDKEWIIQQVETYRGMDKDEALDAILRDMLEYTGLDEHNYENFSEEEKIRNSLFETYFIKSAVNLIYNSDSLGELVEIEPNKFAFVDLKYTGDNSIIQKQERLEKLSPDFTRIYMIPNEDGEAGRFFIGTADPNVFIMEGAALVHMLFDSNRYISTLYDYGNFRISDEDPLEGTENYSDEITMIKNGTAQQLELG